MTQSPEAPLREAPYVVDEALLHEQRLERTRATLRKHGMAAVVVFDPMNVRYVSVPGLNPVFALHASFRWVLVPAEGAPVLWEFSGSIPHLPAYWQGEVRTAPGFTFFGSGWNTEADADVFAQELADLLRERGLIDEPIGFDRIEAVGFLALLRAGVKVADAQPVIEDARAVKSPLEIGILRHNAHVTDLAIGEMLQAMQPGVTEHELWSTFIHGAFKRGAEWCETRLLCSGPRTNPWMQEATHRVIQAGDLVGLDTDLVGEFGYLTDISRTYLVGDGPATDEQRRLFQTAYAYVHDNMPELRPGASFKELGEKLSARFPAEFQAQRYPFIAHGSGMVDEFPVIKFDNNHDGVLEVGMCMSVEAYVGAVGGTDGVKLEQQIVITEDGFENLSDAPFDERLMA